MGWESRGAGCTAHAAGVSTIAAQPVAARLAAPFGRNPANVHGNSAVQGAGRSTAQLTVSMISRHAHTKKPPGARPGDRRPRRPCRSTSQQFLRTHSLFVRPAAYPHPQAGPVPDSPAAAGTHPRGHPQPPEAEHRRKLRLGAAPPARPPRAGRPCAARALGRACRLRQRRARKLTSSSELPHGPLCPWTGLQPEPAPTAAGCMTCTAAPPRRARPAAPAPLWRRPCRLRRQGRAGRRGSAGPRGAQKSTPPPACAFSFSYVSKYW